MAGLTCLPGKYDSVTAHEMDPQPHTNRGTLDLAIIANANTPYREHLHRRIVREMPEMRLWSVFTHVQTSAPWKLAAADEINAVNFGPGESSDDQGRPGRALHEWRKGGRILEFLRQKRVRAVVLLGYNDPGRLRILRWCGRSGVPCLLFGDSNIHGDLASGWKGVLKRQLVPRILRRCAAVLCCGSLGRAYFERYGVSGDRIFYSPYEPDYELIRQLPASALEAAAREHSLPPGRRRIVFSGRLVPVKRVDLAIDAFCAIAPERPGWDLVIAGDGPLRAELTARVPSQLASRVVWTGFLARQEQVSAVYRLSDILLLPSDYEPWALVVNEAAAAGLAIVASEVVGAAPELVRDDVNGYTFPVGDLAALTDRLRRATDPARIDALKAGSAGVLAEWRKVADPVNGLRDALTYCGALT